MDIRCLMISTGYAESTSLAYLVIENTEKGFSSPEEANESFSKAVSEWIAKENNLHKNPCCPVKPKKDGRFCSSCGMSLTTFQEPDPEWVLEVVKDLFKGTLDSHSGFWDFLSNQGWLISGNFGSGDVCVIDNYFPILKGFENELSEVQNLSRVVSFTTE